MGGTIYFDVDGTCVEPLLPKRDMGDSDLQQITLAYVYMCVPNFTHVSEFISSFTVAMCRRVDIQMI